MPETEYIQLLINKDQKKLVVRPCREDERDSFRWCSATAKRSPKQVTCRPFFAMICEEMGWDPNYRYKFLGKMIRSKGESLFLFDLSAPEIYLREVSNEGKVKNNRKPSYPEQWQNQFGIPVSQHAIHTKLNVFDGYTVITIEDDSKKKAKKKTTPPTKNVNATVSSGTPEADSHENISPPVSDDLQQSVETDTATDDDSTEHNKEQQYEQMSFSSISS